MTGDDIRRIASTGGKGGVGKSTFAVLLAFKYAQQGKRVVLCDADVECPNDHLLLGHDLKEPQPIHQEFPTLVEERCQKCGECSEVCRENAIFWVKENYPRFIRDLCTGCGACLHVCPYNAIDTEEKAVGASFVDKVNNRFWLLTGRSNTGVAETGLIAREVKERAITLAKEKHADVLIVDTAPGIHCSVIQAILGATKAYAVTEPTPLGEHDLQLVLQLLQKLDVPSEIVLNRSDVGNQQKVRDIAETFDTDIAIEIPYSKELVKAYASQKLDTMVHLL